MKKIINSIDCKMSCCSARVSCLRVISRLMFLVGVVVIGKPFGIRVEFPRQAHRPPQSGKHSDLSPAGSSAQSRRLPEKVPWQAWVSEDGAKGPPRSTPQNAGQWSDADEEMFLHFGPFGERKGEKVSECQRTIPALGSMTNDSPIA